MGADDSSDMDYLLDAVRELDMTTFQNGLNIEDGTHTLDILSGGMVNMHDDLAGLLGELVDQTGDARFENALLHGAGMAQRAGMWSDMNAGFDELAEGQRDIANRISDVDATLANVGERVDAQLIEVGGKIDEHRQGTVNAIGRLQRDVVAAGAHIAGALHRGSELLSASLAEGFARLNAEEERRMAALRSDLRMAAEMPRENQALEIYKVAAANYAIGDYAQATRDIVEALKLKSNHIPSLILLGKIATHKGKINFAHSRFTRALLHALQQKNAAGFELAIKALGDNHLQRKDSEKAIKLLEKAIVIAKKIFPEMVGRLEWECFRIILPILEAKNDDQGIRMKLGHVIGKYPEGWEALKKDEEFDKLREKYPYLHLTLAVKMVEDICSNEAHRQDTQWVQEIKIFLKIKVPKIAKMTKEMIEVLSILKTQIMLVHDAVMKDNGHQLKRWTVTCQEVFGKVIKTYNELPENKPPENRIAKRVVVPERGPERWSYTETQLAAMSLEQYLATLKKFPVPSIAPHQISHGAKGVGDHDTNQDIVTNDFTRTLRTGWYEPSSPVRRQEADNAIYILVPVPDGEKWQVRKKGERININAGILFLPKSTLVDERTGSKFIMDDEGVPKIDNNVRVKLWDIASANNESIRVGVGVWRQFKECAEKQSVRVEKEFGGQAKRGVGIMKSILDSDYDEFMQDFERQYTGGYVNEEKRSAMRQLIISIYYRWLTSHSYYADGLTHEETWEDMDASIKRIQMLYGIGLMKPKRLVTAESFWREYFQNNPHMQPSKIVYYDGDIREAWTEFWNKVSK